MEIFLDNMKPSSRSSWRFISLLGLLALLSSRRTAIALAAAKIPVRSFVTATPKFAVRGGSSSVLHATIEEIDTKGPTNPSTFHSSEIVATDSTEVSLPNRKKYDLRFGEIIISVIIVQRSFSL